MKGLIQEHFSDHMEIALRDPLLFGDYRTALNPEVPRIYEDIQDYDAAKGLFEEVRTNFFGIELPSFMLFLVFLFKHLCVHSLHDAR